METESLPAMCVVLPGSQLVMALSSTHRLADVTLGVVNPYHASFEENDVLGGCPLNPSKPSETTAFSYSHQAWSHR